MAEKQLPRSCVNIPEEVTLPTTLLDLVPMQLRMPHPTSLVSSVVYQPIFKLPAIAITLQRRLIHRMTRKGLRNARRIAPEAAKAMPPLQMRVNLNLKLLNSLAKQVFIPQTLPIRQMSLLTFFELQTSPGSPKWYPSGCCI